AAPAAGSGARDGAAVRFSAGRWSGAAAGPGCAKGAPMLVGAMDTAAAGATALGFGSVVAVADGDRSGAASPARSAVGSPVAVRVICAGAALAGSAGRTCGM